MSRGDESVMEAYLASAAGDLAPRSVESYRRDLRLLLEYLRIAAVPLAHATSADVVAWLTWLATRGIHAPSHGRRLTAARGLFRHMVAAGTIARDPTARIANPPLPPDRVYRRPAAPEAIAALVALGDDGTPRGVRDAAMLRVLCAAGARTGELVAMRTRDAEYESGRVRLGAAPRWVPVDAATLAAVRAYADRVRPAWAARQDDQTHLFLTERGGPMTRQGFWKIVTRQARVAGVRGRLTPASIRNAVARAWLAKGVAPVTVQVFMGYADVESVGFHQRNGVAA